MSDDWYGSTVVVTHLALLPLYPKLSASHRVPLSFGLTTTTTVFPYCLLP